MDLEWDEEKRQTNLRQRGLDFADVLDFDLETIVTYIDQRREYGETRYNSTGYLRGVLCSFCWTERGGKLRIISLRKINDRERKIYEREKPSATDTG
ncbi:BrnT family toxin [Rhizobium tumorigenes]|uniref:BrnT family toxin n=1 Tax=Rhizobium tumorigenes TaxID=2041385 RepID=UPI000DA8A4ED